MQLSLRIGLRLGLRLGLGLGLGMLLLSTCLAQTSPAPWWDNYPRIVQFAGGQRCGTRGATKALALNADVVTCNTGMDPTLGIWSQRTTILEESEPRALEKMHAAGVRTQAYFETFGQAKVYIVQLKKNADGTWVRDRLERQLTRRFSTHWSWDHFDGTGEIHWAGVHNYFDDEEFARPYTLTHPRYGSPPVRYPDGTVATGYLGDAADPRNSRIYDACSSKDVTGKLFIEYGYNHNIEAQGGPHAGLLQVGSQYSGTFDAGKDAACPAWIDYARASARQAADAGLDSMWTDNFSPWDSFGMSPVQRGFGEWSVATFREYLGAHFTPRELSAMGVKEIKTFDVRAYLRATAAAWGGAPDDLKDPSWKSARWLDDPVWRAYKIHRRQNGAKALAAYYRAVKEGAAAGGKPDFLVTGNDFSGGNFGWARGELDMVSSELSYTAATAFASGKNGVMLPPQGSYVPVYKRALEQARGRLGIFWLYVNPEIAGHPGITDVLQYQGLANHALPEPWSGGAQPSKTAGTDETTTAFNAFVGQARPTFGQRTGVAEIGLYYSSSSELAYLTLNGWADTPPGTRSAPAHSVSFLAWGTALSWLHQQWRVVPEWKLTAETLAGLKLLIVPNAEVFDAADVTVLKTWVAHGGKLIVTGASGVRAGEAGNFERLASSSLAGLGEAIQDDPGLAFSNAKTGRQDRLQAFASALRAAGFEGSVNAVTTPYTAGITLYDDARNHRRFVDINNTDVDVASDTIQPAPPIHLEVPLPGWLDAKAVFARVLTPDPNVTVIVKQTKPGVVAIDVTGVVRYASVVLQ